VAQDLSVGLIGLGAFGSRVAMRLLWSGHHTLQVYDVLDGATRVFCNDFGAMAAGSPKMMAQCCDVVFTILPSAAELREVCFGWESLAKGFSNGGVVVDLGVTDPAATMDIARDLKARNIGFVDAPAFGDRDEAKKGALTLIVGGEDDVVARCRPLLDKLGSRVLRAGAAGSAQAMTALVEFQRGAALLAAAEAARLGQALGVSPRDLFALTKALGGAGAPEAFAEEAASGQFARGAPLGLLRRNLDIAARLAADSALRSPLLETTSAAFAEAEKSIGWGAARNEVARWLSSLRAADEGAAGDQPAA
jgi:3-hydroxyisobutyrate dehydrogenase-like beta-hydroxyacid dehydrogenase